MVVFPAPVTVVRVDTTSLTAGCHVTEHPPPGNWEVRDGYWTLVMLMEIFGHV